jgi:hypothetical protein
VLHFHSISASLISQCPTKGKVVPVNSIIAHGDQIHGPVVLVPAIYPRYALNRRLGGPAEPSWTLRRRDTSLSLHGIEPGYWVFQPAVHSPLRLSYTDSKQFSLEIKNCETHHVIIFCVHLLLTLSWVLDSVPVFFHYNYGKQRISDTHTHTHTHTHHHQNTLLCILLFGFQKQKRIYKIRTDFFFRYIIVHIKGFNVATTMLIPIHQ